MPVRTPIRIAPTTRGDARNRINLRRTLTFLAMYPSDYSETYYNNATKYFKSKSSKLHTLITKDQTKDALHLKGIIAYINKAYSAQSPAARRPYGVINIVCHGTAESFLLRVDEGEADEKKSDGTPDIPRGLTASRLAELIEKQQDGTFPFLAADKSDGRERDDNPTGPIDDWTEVRVWACHVGIRSSLLLRFADLFVVRHQTSRSETGIRPCLSAPRSWAVFGPERFYLVFDVRVEVSKNAPPARDPNLFQPDWDRLEKNLASQRGAPVGSEEKQILRTLAPWVTSSSTNSVVRTYGADDPDVYAWSHYVIYHYKKQDPKALMPAGDKKACRAALRDILLNQETRSLLEWYLWIHPPFMKKVWAALREDVWLFQDVGKIFTFLNEGGWSVPPARRPPNELPLTFAVTLASDAADDDDRILSCNLTIQSQYVIWETKDSDDQNRAPTGAPYRDAPVTSARFFHRVADQTPDHIPE